MIRLCDPVRMSSSSHLVVPDDDVPLSVIFSCLSTVSHDEVGVLEHEVTRARRH